jgi:hypothetical protein
MHPVVAELDEEHRRKLLANVFFAALSADRQGQLLDEVLGVRASLDSEDELYVFKDQDRRRADAAELEDSLNTALTVLGRHHQIAVDMIEGLTDFHDGGWLHNGMADLRTYETLSRRMLHVIERLAPEPRDDRQRRTRRNNGEAGLLRWVLKDFGIKFALTTPVKHGPPNVGLDLIGLLADPPVSGDVIRYRLRR